MYAVQAGKASPKKHLCGRYKSRHRPSWARFASGRTYYIIIGVAEANVSRQLLVKAVAALEAQASIAGNDDELIAAIQTALDVLRHRLALVEPDSNRDADSVAMLVADLSGFTALAERQDAERVQEAISAMWQVLDAVVTSWGGQIELHAGDSLVGLFGHPHPRRGDIDRALYAALTIRSELELFNARTRGAAATGDGEGWTVDWPSPAMRIGVHAGPLVIANQDAGRQRVVVGETWRLAQMLEDLASPGEVVTSQPVWEAARGSFEMQPIAQIEEASLPAYRVVAPRPTRSADPLPSPDDLPLLAGRRDELEFLQQRFQLVAEAHSLHTVLLLAEAGGGKSRLIQELERQLRIIHGPISILRSRATTRAAPFALVRHLLAHRLNLRPQYSRYMKAKLIGDALERLASRNRGLDFSGGKEKMTEAVDLLSRLLTPQEGLSPDLAEIEAANEIVLGVVVGDRPTLLILEDIHMADRSSLELVESLRTTTSSLPLLIVATADVAIEERGDLDHLTWLAATDDPFANSARLQLPPLSNVDSRLLAVSMLDKLTPAPLRLVDLLVAEAGGNAFYINQLIELFIALGAIRPGDRWEVDMDKAERVRLPRKLKELIQQRVAQLPDLEQRLLEAGAVIGDTFWDEAVERLLLGQVDLATVDEVLGRLVAKGFLSPEMTADLGRARAYRFQRRAVSEAVYDGLDADERSRFHLRAAAWLRAIPPAVKQRSWITVTELSEWHELRASNGLGSERASIAEPPPSPTGSDIDSANQS